VQSGFDFRLFAAPNAAADQAGRNDLAVVDDERITRSQELWQVGNSAILELRRSSRPHDQQSRGIARGGRPQRDPLRRQVVIEQVGAHYNNCHARPCAGHPRFSPPAKLKTWMAGTSPAMTLIKNAG